MSTNLSPAMQKEYDRCRLSLAISGINAMTGKVPERLPPELWEPLRLELQKIYRRATGETFATITVENDPR